MTTRNPGGRAMVVALLACLASVVLAAPVYPRDPHLDWSEWDDPPASHLKDDPAKSTMDSSGRQHVDEAGVRRLVTTCALRLELSADVCGKGEVPDPQDAYRLHHMHSGDLPCGFEVCCSLFSFWCCLGTVAIVFFNKHKESSALGAAEGSNQ